MKFMHHGKQESGFSLVEVLLSVGVGALIVLGAARIAQDWAERTRHREEANYLMTVNQAAKSYVATNFGAILQDGFLEDLTALTRDDATDNALLVNIGRSIMIPMDSNGGTFYLKDGTIGLAANFPSQSPLGRTPQIYVRHLGSIGNQLTLQILTVTTVDDAVRARPLPRISINDIATAVGPEAGVFSTAGGCSGDINAIFGNWTMSGSLLNSGSRLMSGTPAYCPPSNEARGVGDYVVLQDRVTYSSVASSDYLYRVPISGMPEANQMATNLDMNDFDMVNVSSLAVDNLAVEGDAYVAGAGGSALLVDEAMRVSGDGSRIIGNTGGAGAWGGTVRASDLTVSSLNGDAAVTPTEGPSYLSLNTDIIEVDRNMVVYGNLAVERQLNLNGGTLTTPEAVSNASVIKPEGSVESGLLQVAGPTTLNRLQAATVTSGVLDVGNNLNATNFDVVDAIRFGGNASVGGGADVQEIQIRQLTHCRASVIYDWTQRAYVRTGSIYDCAEEPPR